MNREIVKDKHNSLLRGVPVPNGWKIYTLYETRDKSDRYSFTGGPFGSDLKTEHYTEKGVRVIQLQNIGDGEFLDNYKLYTSENKANELFSCNIFPGDIIISKMAEPLARACIIPNTNKRFLMASDGIRLKVDKERFDTKFILYIINSWFFRKEAIKKGTGTTRLRIGLSDLKNIKIMAPELKEQKVISKIISTWDKAIELKEKLIEQKKEQKKGLMQKLLTGELRLPGFDKGWQQVKLGKLAKLQGGYAFKSSNFKQEGIPIVRISNIDPVITDYNQDFVYYDEINISEDYKIKSGDILIAMSGATTGKVGIYKKNEIAYLNQRVGKFVNLDSSKLDYNFLYYLIMSPMFKLQLKEELATGAQPNISSRQIESFKVKIPSLKEQTSIANILKEMDKTIRLQNMEVNFLNQQKIGLMQLLLTGKVRVKV